MTDDEVELAGKLYGQGMTLAEVRQALVEDGGSSHSINTISRNLHQAGYTLRRPGRRSGTRPGVTL